MKSRLAASALALCTPGVRLSLAVIVVGCILPIAVMAAFLIFDFYEHEQTQLTMNAISRARAMTSVVDRDFASTQAALLVVCFANVGT